MRRDQKNNESTESDIIDLTNSAEDNYQDDIDLVLQNVNNIKSNLGSIAKSFFNYTSDSVNELNNKAKDYSSNWISEVDGEANDQIHEVRNHLKKFFNEFEPKIDENFPRFYQSHELSNEDINPLSLKFSPWLTGRDHFRDFFGGSRRSGKTPFGFYSYKTPSIRHYNECMNKEGESVWDSHGYWRCLFPNSEVPNELLKIKKEQLGNEILTKEDFDSELNKTPSAKHDGTIDFGENGVFFKQYTDYLNWKNIMYENMKQERIKKRHEIFSRREQSNPDLDNNSSNERTVISSSVQSNYNSNMDSNEVVLNEKRTEYYSDGTSSTKMITKSRPFDAKDWVNVTENVDSNSSNSGKNHGWFWNSNDS